MEPDPTAGTPPVARISVGGISLDKPAFEKITKDDMHSAVHNVLRKLHDRVNDMDEGHDPIIKHQGITSSELQHDLKLATVEMVVLDDLVPVVCKLANETTAKVNELSRERNLRDLIEKRKALRESRREEDAFHAKPAAYFLIWNEDAQDLRAMDAEGSRCDGGTFDSDMEEERSDNLDEDVEMGVPSLVK
ncbi:hypothetical protein FPCIR_11390 [Fusarium pseudocircinatum]|uniref:Uncharacterized protein n=1 Tax=Fusarium pseudocircinatum TaxID=56676 RepID=A0A8H5KRY4_9HYPO|nr:hypothetical protein FPCIR_11390 [Fusarium pseudocircinatum]